MGNVFFRYGLKIQTISDLQKNEIINNYHPYLNIWNKPQHSPNNGCVPGLLYYYIYYFWCLQQNLKVTPCYLSLLTLARWARLHSGISIYSTSLKQSCWHGWGLMCCKVCLTETVHISNNTKKKKKEKNPEIIDHRGPHWGKIPNIMSITSSFYENKVVILLENNILFNIILRK